MLNNFKQLNWFYKIVFILSIICPIILFVYRICTGFFIYRNEFYGLPSVFEATWAYEVLLIIIKVYQVLHPVIMCGFSFICLKLNKYKLLTIIISVILFIIGIDNFLYLIELFIVFTYIDIRERYF